MMDTAKLGPFWHTYLATLPDDVSRPDVMPDAWHFCNNESDANALADLVLAGIKQATASLYWSCEADNECVPQVGDRSIITSWDGDPLCIIETTEVTITPFDQVSPQFAYDEGEGDRSLDFWRRVHWAFFAEECAEIGREPAQDMPVVCERFRVIYRP